MSCGGQCARRHAAQRPGWSFPLSCANLPCSGGRVYAGTGSVCHAHRTVHELGRSSANFSLGLCMCMFARRHIKPRVQSNSQGPNTEFSCNKHVDPSAGDRDNSYASRPKS